MNYDDRPSSTKLYDHPDSALRLASVVHRFHIPKMNKSISYISSFATVGRHEKTKRILRDGDDSRARLYDAINSKNISATRVIADARRYQPFIHTILVSCKVQPENARLDQRLLFDWTSGVEQQTKVSYASEAIMFDLVMCIVTEGLGRAISATEESLKGDFASSSREYSLAAGIFDFLHIDQLPKWIARGSKVDEDDLPAECHIPYAKGLKLLFMANGQQMAVATLLMKSGEPNYSLLGKLCLGIGDQLEEFIALLRRDCTTQLERMDMEFFILLLFQIGIQKSLSLYFQARNAWKNQEYGLAIALLSESAVALKTQEGSSTITSPKNSNNNKNKNKNKDTTMKAMINQMTEIRSKGIPDVSKSTALSPLNKELLDLRQHMKLLLHSWEKDNSSVYFESVPQRVPESKKLQEGIQMNRSTPYRLEDVEPVLLVLPDQAEKQMKRSDSDLARELQRKLNAS